MRRNPHEAAAQAEKIGYPVLLKASAGGGGRGIKLVWNRARCRHLRTAAAEARAAFGNDTLYMERYVGNARHIEVQILGDRAWQRDSSGRARLFSATAPSKNRRRSARLRRVRRSARDQICHAAATLARSIGYQSAGTIEFIYDNDTNELFLSRDEHAHPGRTSR